MKRTCIKCGNNEATLKYYGSVMEITLVSGIHGQSYIAERQEAENEGILCTCDACGYEWTETTLDNIDKPDRTAKNMAKALAGIAKAI